MLSLNFNSAGIFSAHAALIGLYLFLLYFALLRLRVSPRIALLLLLIMLGGTFSPEIPAGPGLALNLGGTTIPLWLALYLIFTATHRSEKARALITAAAAAGIMWLFNRLLPDDPGYLGMDIDPLFMLSLIGGTTAYLLGRSRRAAFCGAVLGALLLDLASWLENLFQGLPQAVITLGSGGIFGAGVLSSTLALLLAEGVGEIRERLHRGEKHD